MKKKKDLPDSPEEGNFFNSKDQPNNTPDSSSSFSIFLNSSSSSLRQIFPERKGVFQIPESNKKKTRIQYSNRPNKKNPNDDIIFDDSLLRTPETKSFLNDQYCIRNRKFLFQKLDFTLFQDDELNKLLCHLREYSIDSAMNRNYSEAKKSDALFDKIQYELVQRKIPSNKREIELEASFEEQRKEEIAKLDLELLQFDTETNEKRIQLQNRQIVDFNVFETIWREEKPPKYRKPSSKLLHLLASEKRLARIGEYDEAEKYKSESDKLIEIERNRAQSLLNRDYKLAKSKFQQKQEEEVRIFNESRQQQRDLIMAKRMLTEETIQKRESIIMYQIAQIPKTKNNEDGAIIENQNLVGNDWLKYGTGGNIAKAMYDDHITYENPIPPLIPPNDENEGKRNDHPNLIRNSQKKSPRLNKTEINQNSSSSPRRSNNLNASKIDSSSPSSPKSSLAKNNANSNRLSSVSKISQKRSSIASNHSKQIEKQDIHSSSNSDIKKVSNGPNRRSNSSLSKKLQSSSNSSKTNRNTDKRESFSSINSSKSRGNDLIKNLNSKSPSNHLVKQKEHFDDFNSNSFSNNSFENKKSDSNKKISDSNASKNQSLSEASEAFLNNNLS